MAIDEIWVYTDRSKKEKEAAISWILMEGDEMEEEENGIRVPGEWSITKIEVCAMAVAMRDMMKFEKKKIRLFSNSMSGIMMIRDMKEEGTSAPLWEKMTGVMNEWEKVTIEWIPGHKDIKGNKLADEVAKAMRNRSLEIGGRWTTMNYEEDEKTIINQWKEEQLKKWHQDKGHEYYERDPTKPKHLKGLSTLDCYVLMRLRSGADKRNHEECRNYGFRHHLALCNRFKEKRPELHTLYDDKAIGK